MVYRLTEHAEEDVINVLQEGIELFGARQADNYYDQLLKVLDFLATNPRAARERDEIDPPVRAHPFGSHIIVYRLEGEDVVVVAVRHGRQDWKTFDR